MLTITEWLRQRDYKSDLLTHKMNESSRGEPDTEEDGDELHEPDAVTGPQHVHILQDVRDGHQTGSSQKPQPCRRSH